MKTQTHAADRQRQRHDVARLVACVGVQVRARGATDGAVRGALVADTRASADAARFLDRVKLCEIDVPTVPALVSGCRRTRATTRPRSGRTTAVGGGGGGRTNAARSGKPRNSFSSRSVASSACARGAR